jgi:hypothetical protein
MKQLLFCFFAFFSLVAFNAHAGVPLPEYDLVTTTSGSSEKTDNQAYAGLVWTWGDMTPAAVIGFSHGKVESDGDTEGVHASLSINFAGGFQFGKAKLTYLNGKEDFQGEAGIGYDLMTNSFLIPVGVNAPHVAGGIDVYRSSIEPYFMLHTRDEFDKPDERTVTECRDVGFGNGTFIDDNCTNTPPQ